MHMISDDSGTCKRRLGKRSERDLAIITKETSQDTSSTKDYEEIALDESIFETQDEDGNYVVMPYQARQIAHWKLFGRRSTSSRTRVTAFLENEPDRKYSTCRLESADTTCRSRANAERIPSSCTGKQVVHILRRS